MSVRTQDAANLQLCIVAQHDSAGALGFLQDLERLLTSRTGLSFHPGAQRNVLSAPLMAIAPPSRFLGIHRAQLPPPNGLQGRITTELAAVFVSREMDEPRFDGWRQPVIFTYSYQIDVLVDHAAQAKLRLRAFLDGIEG